MRAFAALFNALEEAAHAEQKLAALVRYFSAAPPADAAWALYLLCGRKLFRAATSSTLREWALAASGLPEWLFAQSLVAAGDPLEAIALILPASAGTDRPLHDWMQNEWLPLRGAGEAERREATLRAWSELDPDQRYVWNRLLAGTLRLRVPPPMLVRALARVSGVEAATLAWRLEGDWEPTLVFYERLVSNVGSDIALCRPYPFCQPEPLSDPPETLSEVNHWLAEWQWSGLRVQAIRRGGQVILWSQNEELLSTRFPDLASALLCLPDGTVLDGEILAWEGSAALPHAQLARRLSRKAPDRRTLGETPVAFLAYDLLEQAGQDVCAEPLRWRREILTHLLAAAGQDRVLLAPAVGADSWESLAAALAGCRERHAEGLLLRRLDSPYRAGPHPDWRFWTNAPFIAQAVLIYAQRGTGPRPDLHAEYTFGVWENGALVPIAKTGAGLAEAEIEEIDAFVRENTLERFGPVRTVRPELVFELAFEAIHRSTRHKSGLAVRAPRILRRRTDLRAEQAATLAALRALLHGGAP